ncbi:MAG: c-type cytochrome [Polyangiales bacterium]
MAQFPWGSVLTIGLCLAAVGCNDHAGGPIPAAKPAEEKDFGKDKQTGDPATKLDLNPPPVASAEQVFATRCAACHGQSGHGDGPASAALNPKPRNYSDAAWQKSVTDDQIKKAIVEGGQAVGKSPLMAPNPDLANQPQVVEGLVKIVRSFGAGDGKDTPTKGS